MTKYVTTIGEKIYVPDEWDLWSAQSKEIILVHEGVHVEQYRAEKFLYYLKYLLWPLPAVHAHARLDYELDAYATEIVYSSRVYGTAVFGDRLNEVVEQLTGPMYFWTCINKGYVQRMLTSKILHKIKETKARK